MPNLVGIGNSQVPTNAMLGGLAYQDSVGEINIDKIKARTGNNATDIFVYDTRNDSDGGAWRHRTQNTSWYNEGVSKSRGARKKFPVVAVIVIESQNLTIYDGDDPNLPMWMDFDYGSPNSITNITMLYANGKAVSALNGVICSVGEAGWNDGLTAIDFIADNAKWRNSSYIANWTNGIGNRNIAGGYGSFITAPDEIIVAAQVNDVAMTVLPNAPINDSTGLPIPTIALATDHGVSVILDNGTVVDSTDGLNWSLVNISEANGGRKVVNYIFSGGGTVRHKFIDNMSVNFGTDYEDYPHTSASTSVASNGNSDVYGHSSGMVIYKRGNDPGSYNNADFDDLKAKVTSSFNTGYMYGDIEGAFLSSTDTTNITGSGDGYVTGNDSTFGAAITSLNWSERSGSSGGWNVSGGVLKTGSVSSGEYLDITLSSYTSGQTHLISYTVSNKTGSNPIRWRYNNGQMGSLPSSNGTHYYYITLTETGTLFSLLNDANMSCDIDNFKIQLISDDDRSGNGKGLIGYGTITKTAVATGAELVAYSGFSGSNYLQMASGNIGSNTSVNGPLTIMCWFKGTTNGSDSQTLIMIGPGSQHEARGLLLGGGGELAFIKWNNDPVSSTVVTDNQWHHCVATVDSSSTVKLYVDGNLVYNQTTTLATSSSTQVRIGYSNGNNAPLVNGSLALCRISNSVASSEQIKKIYDDEKCLYHENAKCTLYGTSDAITALAFDDSNDVLHAGTSSGRSEFQGLNRINNTTTAVTTAISASNELVAEQ